MFKAMAEAGQAPAMEFGEGASVLRFDARFKDAIGQCVLELVAMARGIQPELLRHRTRGNARVAVARQLAMYLMHVALGRHYADVGRFFDRDRTTVAHACAVIEEMREAPGFDAEVELLEATLSDVAADAKVCRARTL